MFEGNPITIAGFLIPSDNPVFLAILSIHILAALICVTTGIMAMFAQKRPGLHPKSGTAYYWSLWIVFVTDSAIAIARWKEDYHLFILGGLSVGSALAGRAALKHKWQKWSIVHITGMGFSYIFLLTAFYVDNGKFLPVWKNFNPLVYWLLPPAVGIPLVVRTLRRHPLSRKYFKKD